MHTPYLVIAALLVISTEVRAESYKFNHAKFKMRSPASWQAEQDFLGVPLTLFGPMKGNRRPVISVYPTEKTGITFDEASLKEAQYEYKEDRQAFMEKHDGEVIKFLPYKKEKLGGGVEAHRIGYRYKLNGAEFAENSYYLSCKNRFYHIKTLVSAELENEYGAQVDETVKSFECE